MNFNGAGLWNDESPLEFANRGIIETQAVPFEFSPTLGILALGALGGLNQLKRKLQKRKLSKSAFSIN